MDEQISKLEEKIRTLLRKHLGPSLHLPRDLVSDLVLAAHMHSLEVTQKIVHNLAVLSSMPQIVVLKKEGQD
jgi:hypothetical protein